MTQRHKTDTFVQDPGRIADLARAIATGQLSPVDLVRRYLARIEAVDPQVKAWVRVDADRALATAEVREKEARAGRVRGPLHGIPVGIKDIIDVEGLPSRCGSKSRADALPATADAEIVLALKAQGAIILGKVHTTEFAFFDPSPARNPHDVGYTPGGSSAGSAAALAAGMAPLTIGTQTVASVNRPAAYCGIAAFKPSTRSLSTFGIAPLGPGWDTPGFYGWTIADAIYAFEAVAPDFLSASASLPFAPTIAILDDPLLADMDPQMAAALEATAKRLAATGAHVQRRASPIDFARLSHIQRTTMLYEASRAMRPFLELAPGQIGDKLRGAITDGLKVSTDTYLDERRETDAMRATLLGSMRDVSAFLWPAAPGAAPKGLEWTGDPKYIAPWTAIGGPILSMPSGTNAEGMPLGTFLAGAPGTDHALAALARRYG
jgi:aspartyl-tRNA(Asn)/glutamyl-tRNA(Gln) amidotransferase subunit A